MATGSIVTGHFFPIEMTGILSNVGSHATGNCSINNTNITINGVSKGTWTESLYKNDYFFLPRVVDTGYQHLLLQAYHPNNESGNAAIVVWNQSDTAKTATFTISGFLIPKVLCQSTTDTTYYKPYLFKEYGVSSAVSVPGKSTNEVEIPASRFSYSIPTNYRALGVLNVKTGSSYCTLIRIEPYIGSSSDTILRIYNFSSSAVNASPTFRILFVKSNMITYI